MIIAESGVRESDVREQVRPRYARAAEVGGRTALEVIDADQCCAPAFTVPASSTTAPTGGAAGDLLAANASCCGGGGEVDAAFGSSLYSADEQSELPAEAVAASLGCGNPMAVADLKAGEKVLDLGSGGGIDVLLSARRVGLPDTPTGST